MPKSEKTSFSGASGQRLEGVFEKPDGEIRHYALYAHCFTCTMAIKAAVRIARILAEHGIATLRFDFSGLGRSEGDFSDTTFSSDIADIHAAGVFLEQNGQSPGLLIGHSLGGAAVLGAGGNMDSVKAIATIGAPSAPEHVKHLFEGEIDKILSHGKAAVNLGGQRLEISRKFIEDIQQYDLKEKVKKLGKALLILHAPTDATVGIENAQELYLAARHPKSFISLAGADHLLTNSAEADYAARVIAVWAEKYLAS